MPQVRFLSIALFALASAALSSCSGVGYRRPLTVQHERVELDSGLAYEDLLAGIGEEARRGATVTIEYTAWLADGTHVDSTYDRGIPFAFRVGEAPLPGWDQGLIGMRAGGKRKLYVPPALAYGEAGVPGLIPPGAMLTFLIELVQVEPAAGETPATHDSEE